ncbi:MAG: AmmeMemoRadiSam system radical SAM enzyme [Candidatus Altiarchaeota archaeon]
MESDDSNFLNERISRRDFIKKSALALAGVGLGAYGLGRILSRGRVDGLLGNSSSVKPGKWSREAYFYAGLGDSARCLLCPNECIVKDGERGVCRSRTSVGGVLYTLAYGNPCSVHVDPIEKKPLYHFLPESSSFSIATGGCNFRCLNCQNWSISQYPPDELKNFDLMPEKVVEAAANNKCESIAYTYSEPSTFYEYMHDTASIAVEQGIRGVWVTNGYLNREPLEKLCKVVHAANVDLKAFDDGVYLKLTSGRLQPVLETLKTLKANGVWFEVTNLVVPYWTDDMGMIREMCAWLKRNIGPDYPLHFSRFHPEYKLTNLPPTPTSFLESAWDTAKDEGLNHVYIGNVPGSGKQDTYCPDCGGVVIQRRGYEVSIKDFEDGYCGGCGARIAGVWK